MERRLKVRLAIVLAVAGTVLLVNGVYLKLS
jgi:hypothetical protein